MNTNVARFMCTMIVGFTIYYFLGLLGVGPFFRGFLLFPMIRFLDMAYFLVWPDQQRYVIWYQSFDGLNGFYLSTIDPEKAYVKTGLRKNAYRFEAEADAYSFLKVMGEVHEYEDHLPSVHPYYN